MPDITRSTIYLDVEDDITSIIGQLTKADNEEVALVVPKRSTVLQSAVNLKLLKKAAATSHKRPILVTEDAAINKIASRLDILTAANLRVEAVVPKSEQSKPPAIPSDVIEGEALDELAKPTEAKSTEKPAGPELASAAGAAAITAASEGKAKPTDQTESGTKKRRGIPNFDLFKKRVVLIVLGIVGFGFLIWWLFFSLPKANIVIEGVTAPLATSFDFTADTKASNPDNNNKVLPATTEQVNKTFTATFAATGQQNNGNKASGKVTMAAQNCSTPDTPSDVPAGTNLVANNLTYITQSDTSFVFKDISGGCINYESTSDTPITAQKGGSSYNTEDGTDFTVTGRSDVSASGSASAGTDKLQTVVQQLDINAAQKNLLDGNQDSVKKELAGQFSADLFVLNDSYKETVKQSTSAPAVGKEATTATLTLEVDYSESGVKKGDLTSLMKQIEQAQANGQNKQGLGVVDEGLAQAKITLKSSPSKTAQIFHIETTALLGPDINLDQLRNQLAGKKAGEAAQLIENYANVNNATVSLSPFWVTHVPNNPSKVTIQIKVPTGQ